MRYDERSCYLAIAVNGLHRQANQRGWKGDRNTLNDLTYPCLNAYFRLKYLLNSELHGQ
ncbi:MAG TPA: hypothetical protein V6D16_13400 [Candidatus Obscuribacterales bacterium]